MTISAGIMADSISPQGIRLTTMHLRYPRFIHAEMLTHRCFCLSGDAILDFELPAGSYRNKTRRIYSMSLREFADKWFNGVRLHKTSRHNKIFLDDLDNSCIYSASQIAELLQHKKCYNINTACRLGEVKGAYKFDKSRSWFASGEAWKSWRALSDIKSFSIRNRLRKMQIRQLNENTGEVIVSTVVDCISSGEKTVYRISAGSYCTVASKNHLFLTDKGWKQLWQIHPLEDTICVYKYGDGKSFDPYKKINGKWVAQWAKKVKQEVASRQGYLCAFSGEPLGDYFDIHHIQPKHKRPDLAFDSFNVIAVTPKSHKKLHEKQGWQIGVSLTSQFITVDSIEEEGLVDTYDLTIAGEFANFFADGIVVHNSRNSSSSRAIPVERMIADIERGIVIPECWWENQKGMQANNLISLEKQSAALIEWAEAARSAIKQAKKLAALGVHKAWVNRILEPYSHINTIVTATDWDNFYTLRRHKDAQPEIHQLADAMYEAQEFGEPVELTVGEWHAPFIDEKVKTRQPLESVELKVSAARCARTSYLTFDNKLSTFDEDLVLYNKLLGSNPIHASPSEHQATPWNTQYCRNFKGWKQFRHFIEGGE